MTLFQILTAAGFLALFVTLLYLWADVRELKAIAKENRRELLRKSFGARAPREDRLFSEEKGETSGAEEQRKAGEDRAAVREGLKAEEQQILQEVLTEFLG